jgi:hypothetical protein
MKETATVPAASPPGTRATSTRGCSGSQVRSSPRRAALLTLHYDAGYMSELRSPSSRSLDQREASIYVPVTPGLFNQPSDSSQLASSAGTGWSSTFVIHLVRSNADCLPPSIAAGSRGWRSQARGHASHDAHPPCAAEFDGRNFKRSPALRDGANLLISLRNSVGVPVTSFLWPKTAGAMVWHSSLHQLESGLWSPSGRSHARNAADLRRAHNNVTVLVRLQ